MKPLVYWCRWHDARLRLGGRDETAVWGEIVLPDGLQQFHFDLRQWVLTLGTGDTARQIQLDEMGIERTGS